MGLDSSSGGFGGSQPDVSHDDVFFNNALVKLSLSGNVALDPRHVFKLRPKVEHVVNAKHPHRFTLFGRVTVSRRGHGACEVGKPVPHTRCAGLHTFSS